MANGRAPVAKASCENCFFRQNLLCAVADAGPCAHVPAGPSGRPASAQPAALRLPPGAPPPGRLGVPLAQRAGRAARLEHARAAASSVYVRAMYWPLIGGFIAFVLLAVFLGWVMDPRRRRRPRRH